MTEAGKGKEEGAAGGVRRWVKLIQKPTTVLFGENTREPPRLVLERLDVHDLDQQDVARLGAFDLKGPTEVVHLGEVYILDVVGRVVVLDLASGPVASSSK